MSRARLRLAQLEKGRDRRLHVGDQPGIEKLRPAAGIAGGEGVKRGLDHVGSQLSGSLGAGDRGEQLLVDLHALARARGIGQRRSRNPAPLAWEKRCRSRPGSWDRAGFCGGWLMPVTRAIMKLPDRALRRHIPRRPGGASNSLRDHAGENMVSLVLRRQRRAVLHRHLQLLGDAVQRLVLGGLGGQRLGLGWPAAGRAARWSSRPVPAARTWSSGLSLGGVTPLTCTT